MAAISSTNIAKAAEALIRHPSLSPAARRVGLELLNRIDRQTGLAWPSEARLAESCSLSVRSIRRGKAELARLGLLKWVQRGTSRRGRTPIYSLALEMLATLASAIKARIKTACDRARTAIAATTGHQPPPIPKPSNDGPGRSLGRTRMSAYPTQFINFKNLTVGILKGASPKGFWKAPGTPQGQALTNAQLDAKAAARIYDALSALGQAVMGQFVNHPCAAQLEAEAVTAERFSPAQGRTGLSVIVARLQEATA